MTSPCAARMSVLMASTSPLAFGSTGTTKRASSVACHPSSHASSVSSGLNTFTSISAFTPGTSPSSGAQPPVHLYSRSHIVFTWPRE